MFIVANSPDGAELFVQMLQSVSRIIPTSFWWWVALWKLTMAIVCDKAAVFNGYHWSGLVSRCTGQYVGLHLRLHAIMPMGWRGSTLKGCSLSNYVWSGSTPGQHLFVVLSKAVGECMHGFWFNKFCHCLVCELDVYEGMVSFSERELSLSACALFPDKIPSTMSRINTRWPETLAPWDMSFCVSLCHDGNCMWTCVCNTRFSLFWHGWRMSEAIRKNL